MTSERKFIAENTKRVLLKEYLMKMTERAGFGGLNIQRTPMGTRVSLVAERPGMVIGRRGATIKEITRVVDEEFHFDNPQIEVLESDNPNLNAQIMAHKLASALERGWHFRRAGHSTVRRIMESGAKGCQVIISGKLTGQRHRTEKFKSGHIKYSGEPAIQWMEEGFAVAKKKLGVIGIKVQIMNKDARLPDEIDIVDEKMAGKPPEFPENEASPDIAVEGEVAPEAAEVEVTGEAPEEEINGEVEGEVKGEVEEAKETEPEKEKPKKKSTKKTTTPKKDKKDKKEKKEAEEPKVDEPPSEEPATDEKPPAEGPKVDEPPSEEPATDEKPPAEEPKVDEPPSEEPATNEKPPAEEPKVDEPPSEEPATDEKK